VICQQGHVGAAPDARHPNLSNSEDIPTLPNPDAPVSCPSASDSTGSFIDQANEHETAGRSPEDDWRLALHEAAHVALHLINGDDVCGTTIVPDGDCEGRTWGPQGAASASFAGAIWNADSISECEVSLDSKGGAFVIVRQAVIALMAGYAAETVFLRDTKPKYIAYDVPQARRLAGFVCRNMASILAFMEHGYQEAQELVEQHKDVVQAIAQALIDHPKRTLDSVEIDAVIAPVLAAQAAADEHKRRADWRSVEKNAANFPLDWKGDPLGRYDRRNRG
jgi:hypothetical protein